MENNDPYEELEIYLKQINNEILEEFDKTSQANGNDSAIEVNDTTVADSICSESPKVPVLKSTDTASLRRRYHGHVTKKTTNSDEEWNSLDQFEKLVKSEMEYLTSQNHQKSNGLANDMSTKINHQPILKPEKHVSIPLQSFSNKTKCITNINNCQENQKPPSKSSSNPKSDGCNENTNDEAVVVAVSSSSSSAQPSTKTTTTTADASMTGKVKDSWSSDDSILKSIDEDNKSTSSTVSSSSAFEDSTNIYSEKSESSMSSINIVNHNNKLNESGKVKNRIAETKLSPSCGDDSLEVLSSYDNDSGNDEFDEKGDRFASFSYSSSDGGDRKFRSNYYNSLPLMRVKRNNVTANFNSMKRKHFNRSAIDQEPFHDDTKVINLSSPSPSCGSWSSDSNMLQQTFNSTKSSSVPILVKSDQFNEDFNKLTVLRNSRSQSDRYLCEIQAAEAMKWLREAGFPQYAQMYEDLQFPIDLSCVEKNVERDHPFLQKDQLQALYRRLLVLNRSATMRLDGQYNRNINKRREDSDEDVCALSENWQFQPEIRRWSRVGDNMGLGPLSLNLPKSTDMGKTSSILPKPSTSSRESTPEEFEIKVPHMMKFVGGGNYLSVPPAGVEQDTDNSPVSNLKRSGSERLRDGAKNFLRRVESIKSRRKKKKNREGVVISGPMHLDIMQLNQKFQNINMSTKDPKLCKSSTNSPILMSPVGNSSTPLFLFADSKICPASDKHVAMFGQHLSPHSKPHPASRTSPLHFFTHKKQQQQQQQEKQTIADDSSSLCSELSQDSSNGSAEKKLSPVGRYFYKTKRVDETVSGTLSDSEAVKTSRQQQQKKSKTHKSQKSSTLTRGGGGSFNLGQDSNRQHRDSFKTRRIFRSRSAVRHNSTNDNDKKDGDVQQPKSGLVVQRWHSFRAQTSTKRDFADGEGVSLCKLSCGQIEKLRKLALVTLTGYMERYCPSHRTGWNWELPKFIKKIKTPDYKDKKVFGVPFSIILQKTGHTLPKGIQAALTWLKINALDQTGIFRKSGVKSRIAKLKALIDQTEEDIIKIFEDQQAYDVADVVKQYFRDLPESLLTTKLSETFVAIFQYVPNDVKFEALQSAILLLPDEHREVLLMLLEFLALVADNAELNQMSASNLSLCLAPSIFQNGVHSNTPTASPRRKKPTGLPDAKDLDENRASTECLTYMILNHKRIYQISSDKMNRCNFSYMEESRPVTLESLGDTVQLSNWRSYLYECVKATVKEGREKSRGWMTVNSHDPNIEIFCRKVGDGHPLKLWKCTAEIEATPMTILNRITKERHLWDKQLLKMRVIESLDANSDIFQYACSSGHTATDYCVLRTSNIDLPRGQCVTVEISIDHPAATTLLNAVRGVVLASRYLIEPCGNGKSKVMHLARVDTKGRTVEWYKNFGFTCALNLARIRDGLKIKSLE